jgi:hypothetical protein
MLEQQCEQRFRLSYIGGLKAVGEAAVDFSQKRTGFGALAAALPQLAQTRGGSSL